MADYRLYFLDEANHIRGVAEFQCDDDQSASAQAESHADGRRMELWSRDRFVRRFDPRTETA